MNRNHSLNRRQFLGTAATGILAGTGAAGAELTARPSDAKYVWYDDQGVGRNLFGLFRRKFELAGPVKAAVLNVFADTAYQLFVNGEFVNFGPVRFDPKFPVFDSHDIAHLLKPGRNVIAIQVNHFGLHTFKSMPARGGMIAWGSAVQASRDAVSFVTGHGQWRAVASKAHTRYASALSFALNAADLYDQSGEEEGWQEAGFDDSAWPRETVLASQDSWGALAPRPIPLMGTEPVAVSLAPVVRPLANREVRFSFSTPAVHGLEDDRGDYAGALLFSTFIYSPRAQVVYAGVFYGEHWLNGKPVPKAMPSERPMRYTQRWDLNQGWNHFFGRVKRYHDRYDQYFAVPASVGLAFSAERDMNSPYSFKHCRALTVREYDQTLKSKVVPFPPEDTLPEAGGWVLVRRDEPAQAPCHETSWDEYGDPFERLEASALDGHIFRLADYPHGFALLVDLESMHLFIPRIRMEGVRGATIDLTYSERLAADGAHIAQFSWYPLGDRVLCSRDSIDWIPSNPRGTRYLLLTVRNPRTDVTLRSVSLRSATYPVNQVGRFACSDPTLNAIWELCRRTQATSMEDAYIDCAGRERGLYIRDMVIQYHNNLALYGDQALMGRCLEVIGQSPDASGRFRIIYPNTGTYTHSDFALNAVEGYRAYYEHSGDVRRIRQDWEAILGNLAFFDKISDQRQDLLLAQHEVMGGFQGDADAPPTHLDPKGVNCLYSCAYLLALESALVLARAIERTRDAERIARRIAILQKSIPLTFWDAGKQCFSDTTARRTHSVHSNLFAVRAGVVNAEQMDGVRRHVSREMKSPFMNGYDPRSGGVLFSTNFAFFLFDGLYRAGLPEVAQNMMRQGWGFFLAQGLKTCPEFFHMEGSLSHAWSASPVYYLSKYLLGIHYPNAPDLSRVEVRVQAQGIASAEGVWPHPDGPIEIKWRMDGTKRVFDTVKAPRGVTVQVIG